MSIKMAILNESSQMIGGGWSFINNFIQGIVNTKADVQFCGTAEADVIFIPSSAMVGKSDTVRELKKQGKKIVLRVDNATRDSRNRGAGMGKMKRIAEESDLTIYQSWWAFEYLQPYLMGKNTHVIPNGVNTSIFNPKGDRHDFGNHSPIYLYSRFNRDETKRWEKAWWDYQMIYRKNPNAKLVIVGKFSDELIQYHFDFFMGEKYEYMGIITSPENMAKIYRGCDVLLAPYYNDCYSNTIQEAIACGLEVVMDETGGNREIRKNGVIPIEEMVSNYLLEIQNVIL